MIPLSRRDTAHFIRALCHRHDASPQYIIRKIQQEGMFITDLTRIAYCDGIYHIQSITSPLPGPNVYAYQIQVDGVMIFSQSSLMGALTVANKLTQLLFPAQHICVWHGTYRIIDWHQIAVGIWIGR